MIDPVNDSPRTEIDSLVSEVDTLKHMWDKTLTPFRESLAYGQPDRSYRMVDEQERLRLADSILGFVRDGCTILRQMVYANVIPLEGRGLVVAEEVVGISQRVLTIDGYASAEVKVQQEPVSADIIDFPAAPVSAPPEDGGQAAPAEGDVQPEPPVPPEKPLPAAKELPELIEIDGYKIDTTQLPALSQHENFILARLPYLLAEGSFARKDVLALGFFPEGTDAARAQAFKKAVASLSAKLKAVTGTEVLTSVGNRATSRYVAAWAAGNYVPTPAKPKATTTKPLHAAPSPECEEDDEAPEPKQVFRNSIQERMTEPIELKLAVQPVIVKYLAQRRAKAKGNLPMHDQAAIVLNRYFGIGAEDGGVGVDMITLSDATGLSPYSIRNFVREALKACPDKEAKDYLDYLDSQ